MAPLCHTMSLIDRQEGNAVRHVHNQIAAVLVVELLWSQIQNSALSISHSLLDLSLLLVDLDGSLRQGESLPEARGPKWAGGFITPHCGLRLLVNAHTSTLEREIRAGDNAPFRTIHHEP